MSDRKKNEQCPTFEQWMQAKGKRDTYLIIAGLLLGFAVIGIVVDAVLEKPEPGWVSWIPVNFGTYGIGGISALYVVALIVLGIATFISCIRNTGLGLIVSAIFSVLVFGVGFTLFEKVAIWLYNSINTSFVISFLGIKLKGAMEISVSGTLGGALLNTAIYTLPFLFCTVMAMFYSRKAQHLKQNIVPTIDLTKDIEKNKIEEGDRG